MHTFSMEEDIKSITSLVGAELICSNDSHWTRQRATICKIEVVRTVESL